MGLFFKNGLLLFDGDKFRGCCCPEESCCRGATRVEITGVEYTECSEHFDHRYYSETIVARPGILPAGYIPDGGDPSISLCKGNYEDIHESLAVSWTRPSGRDTYSISEPQNAFSVSKPGSCGGTTAYIGVKANVVMNTTGYVKFKFDGFPSSCSHTHPSLKFSWKVTTGAGATVNWRWNNNNGSGSASGSTTIDPITTTQIILEVAIL